MKKPVIIVFGSCENNCSCLRLQYSDAIISSGGIPLLVPLNQTGDGIRQIARVGDGFLFSGGVDPAPELYGEEKLNDTVTTDSARDTLETTAVAEIIKTGKPIFGICRGIQSVNVALGGSLYQDIPAQLPSAAVHRQTEATDVDTHRVNILPGSRLHELTGRTEIMTNTFHHQAIKTPAPSLTPCAYAQDGIIEAMENPAHDFLLLVQWHPEFTHKTSPVSEALFSEFVKKSIPKN